MREAIPDGPGVGMERQARGQGAAVVLEPREEGVTEPFPGGRGEVLQRPEAARYQRLEQRAITTEQEISKVVVAVKWERPGADGAARIERQSAAGQRK